MGQWTKWRKLAVGTEWFDAAFDHGGAACYELSLTHRNGGARVVVYVGETGNERARMRRYARGDSHIEFLIRRALKDGYRLWYRGYDCGGKGRAKAMQDRLLRTFQYDWNYQGQLD